MEEIMMYSFRNEYPSEAKRVVKYWEYCTYELAVQLDDGKILIFDNMDHSIRKAPSYSEQLTEDEFKNEFGRRLQRLLYSKGMTQESLSEATGISQKMISQYITGQVNPSFAKVDKICRALGCSTDKLRYMDDHQLD